MQSRFPLARDEELERIAGVVGHTLAPNSYPLDKEIVNDPHRPHQDIHAYMPNLGPTRPFYNPELLSLCRLLREHYDDVCREYEALLQDNEEQQQDRFQSVTSMNYESGWKTFVLFYNGNRIPGFPYCLPTLARNPTSRCHSVSETIHFGPLTLTLSTRRHNGTIVRDGHGVTQRATGNLTLE